MALTADQLSQLRGLPVGETGNRVRQALALSERPQGEVARELGFAQSYLSNVCRGHFGTITVDNARKLASFFGCTIEDLFPSRAEVA